MMVFPKRGLYAITQTDHKSPDAIINNVQASLRGGAVVVQYRDKNPAQASYVAAELVRICHLNNIPLIINDDIELCIRVNADGVHLGKDDGGILEARERLGNDAIIGASCYDSVERALTAQALGADYVAFGRFFPSGSKPLASPASIETLQKAKVEIRIPIVAIGGILPDNGGPLLQAGADLLAVIGGLFNSSNPELSALAYQPLFAR